MSAPGPRQIVITVTGGHDPEPREIALECLASTTPEDFASGVVRRSAMYLQAEILRRLTDPGAT